MGDTREPLRVVVVGGGISGLATAWYLEKEAAASGLPPVLCTVLEAADRAGGKILTETVLTEAGSFLVEAGPDSFLALQKPWALELARELGLNGRLLGTNDESRRVYVLAKGRPVPLPDGIMMLAPTKVRPFLRSPLISPLGKVRMGLDLLIPRRRSEEDESLGDFVVRRMGREALDKIAEPLLSGIYNADAARQSLLATLPRFREMERRHGSLIRATLAERRRASANGAGRARRPSAFLSFVEGTEELVRGLLHKTAADVKVGRRVVGLTPLGAGRWEVLTECAQSSPCGEGLVADAVVLAVPAAVSASLLGRAAPSAAALLGALRTTSTGTVSLAFGHDVSRVGAARGLRGFGILVPASERRPINAITWSSVKFAQRAPAGASLLRVFFGGSRSPRTMELDDDELVHTVRRQVYEIMGIADEPLFQRIYRWPNGNPQYDIGHLDRVARVEGELPPGVWVTGSPYRGVGVPDCVRQARSTASHVLDELEAKGRGGTLCG